MEAEKKTTASLKARRGQITQIPASSQTLPSDTTATRNEPEKSVPIETPLAEPLVWSEADVSAAVAVCARTLASHIVEFDTHTPLRYGQCGTPAPITLRALGNPKTALQYPAVMNCAVAATLSTWVERVLQPAAREILQSRVTLLMGTSSYVCRNRNNATTGPISEHAFANAFDVSGFALADGRKISVLDGWGPVARGVLVNAKTSVGSVPARSIDKAPTSPMMQRLKGPPSNSAPEPQTASGSVTPEAKFLRRIHAEACSYFSTVLGPEANDAHRDHLHFDLKSRKGRPYCQ